MAKEFKVQVIEYMSYSQESDTIIDDNLNENRQNLSIDMNQMENFKQFISDSILINNRLDFMSNDVAIGCSSETNTNRFSHRLILIEEFPNVFHIKPEELGKLLLDINKRFAKRLIPIVFIISETINGESEEYRLLPKTLQFELKMKTINFKPITDTSLLKTLQRLSDNRIPKNKIEKLIDGASGDIRCAINNMQLLYMHSIDNKCDKNVKKLRKTKQMLKSKDDSIDDSNDYLSRDPSLTITHAIGKVLYAKRIDSENQWSNSHNSVLDSSYELPPHLKDKERFDLKDNPDSIAEKIVVSSNVFNAWLHQNYIEFCDSLETAEQCIDWLCLSDTLFSGEPHFNEKSIFESYKSSLSLRGLMFNLSKTNRQSIDAKQDSTAIKTKPKYSFKPFEKPHTFAVNRFANSLKRQISQSLSQKNPFYGINSIVIDFMPFVSQMPKHLQKTDNKFRYFLDKVVAYHQNRYQFNEHELSNALSESSFANSFDERLDEITFETNTNEDKSGPIVSQIDKPIDEIDSPIDSDSD